MYYLFFIKRWEYVLFFFYKNYNIIKDYWNENSLECNCLYKVEIFLWENVIEFY